MGNSRLMRKGGGVMSRIVSACEDAGGLMQLDQEQVEQATFALMSFFQ